MDFGSLFRRIIGLTTPSVSVLINILVVVIICRAKDLRVNHCILIALALADISVPFITFTASVTSKLSEQHCQSFGCMIYLPIQVSILTQCLLSFDRCFAVANPIKYRAITMDQTRAKRVTVLTILAITAVLVVYDLLIGMYNLMNMYIDPGLGLCTNRWDWKSFMLLSPFTWMSPVFQIFANGILLFKMLKLKKPNREKVVKATCVVVLTVALFYISMIPQTCVVVMTSMNLEVSPDAEWAAAYIIGLQGCFSFPIYYFHLKDFKETLRSLCQCRCKTTSISDN